jgi:dihydropyrimidine dehydrogenase (NADP+)
VIVRNGHIVGMELYKMDADDSGDTSIDEDQFVRMKCDFVISAFGSKVPQEMTSSMSPMTLGKWGSANVDVATGEL